MIGPSNTVKEEESKILAEEIALFKKNGGVVRVISKEQTDARIKTNIDTTRIKLKKDFTFDKK